VDRLLADISGNTSQFVTYVLAVVGGFLVGYILTFILCRMIAKLVFKRRMPEVMERALRVIGGILVAALVAWLLFRGGFGWGLGGTGGTESGNQGGDSGKPKEQGRDSGKSTPETVPATRSNVRIEPASVMAPRFRFEGDPEALELDAAKVRLAEIQKSAKGEPQLDIHVYANSTAVDNTDVRKFIEHAHTLGYSTRVKKYNERLP